VTARPRQLAAGFHVPAHLSATSDDALARIARWIMLTVLIAAPLAMGSVHEPAFIPLLVLAAVAGLLSWWRPVRDLGRRATAPPGAFLLLVFLALIVVQLVPLPPWLLRLVSPGTYAFHTRLSLVPLTTWQPISVNPADTGRGLAFAAAFALLYAAAARECAQRRWRHQVVWVIVATGFVATITGLVQAASATPTKIYGLWRPLYDWAVFGPYVNHNHYANYLVMAAPLSLALLAESLTKLSAAWRARRWLACGDPPASRALVQLAVTLTLMVGLLSARSRGGIAASLAALTLLALVLRRSRLAALTLLVLLVATVWFVDPRPVMDSLHARPFAQTRWPLWKDALRAVPRFPLLGAGFNAYGTLSPCYQSTDGSDWVGETHNDYLQILVDTGLVGFLAIGGLLVLLACRATRSSQHTVLGAGLFAALAGCGLHNVIEFGWQIPANAATFVVLAGVTMGENHARHKVRNAVDERAP
jgi:O-antigen ligase